MGANHGAGNDGSWFEVSDTFSTRWGERELACRLPWLERVRARPAVQKGLTIPEPFPPEKQFEGFIKATVGLGDLHA
jgi:hypothetical protein